MKQEKWFNRSFDFHNSNNIFPSIIERLSGTPARLEEKLNGLPASILSVRIETGWTIKEHAGHLSDLEPLWQGRLEDILQGEIEMRPTDLQNAATTNAHHDAVPLEALLQRFRNLRNKTIRMLEPLDEQQLIKSALHPRLKTPMRISDLFLFVAEHDDHHLAAITMLAKNLNKGQ